MIFYHKYIARNEFINLKLVEIGVLHKFIAQTVQMLLTVPIFKMATSHHLGFEGQMASKC